MHIALISPFWPLGSAPNGIVTYVDCMRREFIEQGHKVSIISATVADESGKSPDVYLAKMGLAQRLKMSAKARLGIGDKKLDGWVDLWMHALVDTIARIHRRHPIDVVEMEESYGCFAEVAKRVPMPVVVKLHGPAFLSYVEEAAIGPSFESRVQLERVALSGAQFVIAPSASTLNDTYAFYKLPWPRVAKVIENPLTLPADVPLWTLEGCDRRSILFVGRFDKRKGADILLRAFVILLRSHPDLQLTFVGPDLGIVSEDNQMIHFTDYVATLLDEEQRARIDYRGPMQWKDILPLRPRSLVTVACSRWESQGYTALEAMGQACPVIVSDAGGLGETVVDGVTGLIARAGDASHLAEKLAWMIDHPEQAALLGKSARRRATDWYASPRLAIETMSVYEEAIGNTA